MENKKITVQELPDMQKEKECNPFCDLCFAGRCGNCGYYRPDDSSSGWCNRHGGWVSPDKWSCDDYC